MSNMYEKDDVRTLYRPVGIKELQLIFDSNWRHFPPRLDWQPIFYPVLNMEYAIQIASNWNIKDAASGYAGFVTEFDVETKYIAQFQEHVVGNNTHRELWIPAEELETFNDNIQGNIRVIAAFYGDRYEPDPDFHRVIEQVLTEKGRG